MPRPYTRNSEFQASDSEVVTQSILASGDERVGPRGGNSEDVVSTVSKVVTIRDWQTD